METNVVDLISKTDIFQAQQYNQLQEEYDFLIYREGDFAEISVKSGKNNTDVLKMDNLAAAFDYVFKNHRAVKIKSGIYQLDSDLNINNKNDIILEGQGLTILDLNGHTVTFFGNDYLTNGNNKIRNFVIINGTIRFENSYRATLQDTIFFNCTSAIEIANTNKWSEATKLENIHWENCQTAVTFKTPINNSTGSYENTALERCYINLYEQNTVGIMVEEGANVSNSEWSNLRIWLHENYTIGLHLEGSMAKTVFNNVAFESFAKGTVYGIFLGEHSTTGFTLGSGVSFLGHFENRIMNPDSHPKWIYGEPSLFSEKHELEYNNASVISRDPLTISRFDAFIKVENLFQTPITVQITVNFIDHTSNSKKFILTDNEPRWLDKEDLFELYPSQNVIWNIEATLLTDTNADVIFGVMGSAK